MDLCINNICIENYQVHLQIFTIAMLTHDLFHRKILQNYYLKYYNE